MTTLGPLRAQLLSDYMNRTRDTIVGGGDVAIPTLLAVDYIGFLTGEPNPDIPGKPVDWDRRTVARTLTGAAGRHAAPHTAEPPIAEYTPSPFVGTKHRHRGQLWPWRGDIIVFGGTATNPSGTLGIYYDHDHPGTMWDVWTQSFGPAALWRIDATDMTPLGWWRVTDDRLRARKEVKTA